MQLLQIEIRSALQEQGFRAVIYLRNFLGEVVIEGVLLPHTRTLRISKKNGSTRSKIRSKTRIQCCVLTTYLLRISTECFLTLSSSKTRDVEDCTHPEKITLF
jgi:hypothetical protein